MTILNFISYFKTARFILALLGFLGFVMVFALRANLSVAIITMVNTTAHSNPKTQSYCTNKSASKTAQPKQRSVRKNIIIGEFNWDAAVQGYVLAAFYYGYTITQIPGGWLTTISAKYTVGLGILWTAILTLFTPMAARMSPWALFALRFFQGLGQGVISPALHAMLSKWAPPLERSVPMGNVIAYPLCGWLSLNGFAGGWPSVFYVTGIMGCIWFILWVFFVYETPQQHPRISHKELEYLIKTVPALPKRKHVPWLKIFTSLPFWAIAAAHFAYNWGLYTWITVMPTFYKQVLGLDAETIGFYSALPFITQWIFVAISGPIADYFRSQGYRTRSVRRFFNTTGLVIPAILHYAVGFVKCNILLTITLVTLSSGIMGMTFASFFVSHLDISPRYAGVLMGLTNTLATLPGVISPSITALIIKDQPDLEHWRTVFLVGSCIYIIGAVIYYAFISDEEQKWSRENQ